MIRRSDTSDIERLLGSHPRIDPCGAYVRGDTFGKWRVEAFLGKGGNGEVYRVVHEETGAAAALKISSHRGFSPERLLREAEFLEGHACGRFPRLYERGEKDGMPFFVMELLEPAKLPSDDRRVAKMLLEVGGALSELHCRGFVHRDVKPSNVMVRPAAKGKGGTEAVLIDLGLLKRHESAVGNPGKPAVTLVDGRAVGSGTPRYAAPEQFNGGGLSPAADIHALGVLAAECFGGDPPAEWRPIIRRATSSISGMRYQSVGDFMTAVRRRHFMRGVVFSLAIAAAAGLAAASWQKFSFRDISLGEALGCPGYEWETSADPWYVHRSSGYEGGAAVLASGGGGGVVETYIKTVVAGAAKKMSFRFQRMYYNGRFTVEIDGEAVFSDQSISRDEGDNWKVARVDIPAGEHEIKFTYRHPGVGYRNIYNGVRIDTVTITD